jgi:hypothetical protein
VEINRRIWRAQLKVHFPFIEQQRNGFIDLIRRYLSFVPNEADLGYLIKNHLPRGTEDVHDVFPRISDSWPGG